jgi:hypothetical protein
VTILFLRRVGNSLVPDGDESIVEFVGLPFGKPMRCEVKQPRNGAFHRLYWALCARIAGGIRADAENISDVLKIATGHYTTIRSKSYGEIRVPKSISFAAMDNQAFGKFFEECVRVIYAEWGVEPSAVEDLLAPQAQHAHERAPAQAAE